MPIYLCARAYVRDSMCACERACLLCKNEGTQQSSRTCVHGVCAMLPFFDTQQQPWQTWKEIFTKEERIPARMWWCRCYALAHVCVCMCVLLLKRNDGPGQTWEQFMHITSVYVFPMQWWQYICSAASPVGLSWQDLTKASPCVGASFRRKPIFLHRDLPRTMFWQEVTRHRPPNYPRNRRARPCQRRGDRDTILLLLPSLHIVPRRNTHGSPSQESVPQALRKNQGSIPARALKRHGDRDLVLAVSFSLHIVAEGTRTAVFSQQSDIRKMGRAFSCLKSAIILWCHCLSGLRVDALVSVSQPFKPWVKNTRNCTSSTGQILAYVTPIVAVIDVNWNELDD